MKVSFKSKAELAEYVNDRLDRSKPDYVLTMIISQGLSADSYVLTVTEESLEDTAKKSVQNSSEPLPNIYKKNTRLG